MTNETMAGPEPDPGDFTLRILSVGAAPHEGSQEVLELLLRTTRGDLKGLFHAVEGSTGAAILVSGALGGVEGPADGMWGRLALTLAEQRISTLRLDYREPNDFTECLLDVLGGISFLRGLGGEDVVLAGHSFGAAVVIGAGELSPMVRGVLSLSPQLYGTRTVEKLGCPLLLIHGTEDVILSHEASEDIYRRALDPKELALVANTGHSLIEAAEEVEALAAEWIADRLAGNPAISGRRDIQPSHS